MHMPSLHKGLVRMHACTGLIDSRVELLCVKQHFGKMLVARRRHTRRPLSTSLTCAASTVAAGQERLCSL